MSHSKTGLANSMARVSHRIHIQIDEAFAGDIAPSLLGIAARAALMHQRASSGSLSISLTGDETLHSLNHEYLGLDHPTDVLSFPSQTDDPEEAGRYFGDIAISYPRALAQAETAGHSTEAEVQLLTVHGVLHLLGHDHTADVERDRMWQAQAEILAELGCEITGE